MNRIDEHTENRLREMLRAGYSTRQMASKAGVSRNTANRVSLQYRQEAPLCRHDKPLYECASCANSRRFASPNRDILWIKPGPRKSKERQYSTEEAYRSNDLSAEDLLKLALLEVLHDRSE